MSKTLLIIQSYFDAAPQVTWSWPFYTLPGWDVLGVCPKSSAHEWPQGTRSIAYGSGGYSRADTIKRWVHAFEVVLREQQFSDYTDFCMIEHDGVFVRPPPVHSGGLLTCLSGFEVAGFKAKRFFHCPWWPDRATAKLIVQAAHMLIEDGELEHGSPDFFLGLIMDRTGLPFAQTNTWSCNGGNFPQRKEEAANAYRNGAWLFHGFRHKSELEWLLNQCSPSSSPA